MLIICSCPSSAPGNLQQCLRALGYEVEAYGILDGPEFDVTDDAVWGPVYAKNRTGAIFAAPPCGTFSRPRGLLGGPPQIRGIEGAAHYGLKNVTPKQAEQLRAHNLIALRACMAIQCMAEQGRVGVLEQPAIRDGEVSMLRLVEVVTLLKRTNVTHRISTQCPFGAAARKLTSWITTGVSFQELAASCTHANKDWYQWGTGQCYTAPHPPSRGTTLYVSTGAEAVNHRSNSNIFVSAPLAADPALLNRYLAVRIHLAVTRAPHPPKPATPAAPSHWHHRLGKEAVRFRHRLRGRPKSV